MNKDPGWPFYALNGQYSFINGSCYPDVLHFYKLCNIELRRLPCGILERLECGFVKLGSSRKPECYTSFGLIEA